MSNVQPSFPRLFRPLLTLTMTLFMASSLTACDLYLEPQPEYYPPDVSPSPSLPDAGDAWFCETNQECASGCYCTDADWCEESGFCESSEDCFDAFRCDDRSTCVPDVEPEPTPTCSDLDAQETACIAAELCNPVYRGVNCTSDTGEECTAGAESCSCESFELDRCEEIEAAPSDGADSE